MNMVEMKAGMPVIGNAQMDVLCGLLDVNVCYCHTDDSRVCFEGFLNKELDFFNDRFTVLFEGWKKMLPVSRDYLDFEWCRWSARLKEIDMAMKHMTSEAVCNLRNKVASLAKTMNDIHDYLHDPNTKDIFFGYYDSLEEYFCDSAKKKAKKLFREVVRDIPMTEKFKTLKYKRVSGMRHLYESGFLNEKAKSLRDAVARTDTETEDRHNQRLQRAARLSFLDEECKVKKEAVAMYIYFNRKKIADEVIEEFFVCVYMDEMYESAIDAIAEVRSEEDGDRVAVRSVAAVGYDTNAMLSFVKPLEKYVAEEAKEKIEKFWARLVEKAEDLKDRKKCVLKPSPQEKDKDGNKALFSYKFVCNLIGYLQNRGYYLCDTMKIVRALKVNKSARQNVANSLKGYPNSVVMKIDGMLIV